MRLVCACDHVCKNVLMHNKDILTLISFSFLVLFSAELE